MKLSSQTKSVDYLKSHTSEIVRELGKGGAPIVITLNGEAKAVLQDIASYEQDQETLTLLKILALGNREIESGRYSPVAEYFERMRSKD